MNAWQGVNQSLELLAREGVEHMRLYDSKHIGRRLYGCVLAIE
jgi:hypothetical protein